MTVTILHGDVREQLRELPRETFHCVCTSPPYFNLRSYLKAGDPNKAMEIGQEATPTDYITNLVSVFSEVRRVMRDDALP